MLILVSEFHILNVFTRIPSKDHCSGVFLLRSHQFGCEFYDIMWISRGWKEVSCQAGRSRLIEIKHLTASEFSWTHRITWVPFTHKLKIRKIFKFSPIIYIYIEVFYYLFVRESNMRIIFGTGTKIDRFEMRTFRSCWYSSQECKQINESNCHYCL